MKEHASLSSHQLESVAKLFRLLAEPSRLRILQKLRCKPHTVNELADTLNAKQAAVSKQLALLHDAGLLARRRMGNHIEYSIAEPMIFELCELVCGKIKQDARQQSKLFSNV